MSKSLGNVTAPQKITDEFGADILRLWVMNSDFAEDQRIGKEIVKQTAELYRRLRNTLRWLLGSLDGFTESERVDYAEMPELERWVLHRLAELDARMKRAAIEYDWVGVMPELHAFCAGDLSAFYFDVRKDSLYCDRPDSLRRRAARTVLDHLHRALCCWLAPVLCFTAEEAWTARFGEAESVHLQSFPDIPSSWANPALAAQMAQTRALRSEVTTAIEALRKDGTIGASLQAAVSIPPAIADLDEAGWEEMAIVSHVTLAEGPIAASVAPGAKCVRCWRVLEEVGQHASHPGLCLRCEDAVESGLVGQPKAAA